MSRWLGTIDAHHRRWWTPALRALHFYDDATVIACGPRSVHWRRFVAGAKTGGDSALTDSHEVDVVELAHNLAEAERPLFEAMIAEARSSSPATVAAQPGNRLVQLDRIVAKGMHPQARLTLEVAGAEDAVLYIGAHDPAFSTRLKVMDRILGDRLVLEGIRWKRPA